MQWMYIGSRWMGNYINMYLAILGFTCLIGSNNKRKFSLSIAKGLNIHLYVCGTACFIKNDFASPSSEIKLSKVVC